MYPPSILGEKSIREIETTHLTHLPRSLLSPLPTLPKRGSSTLRLPLVGSATFSRLSSRGEERRARKSGDRDREETRRRTFGCAARSGRKRRVRVRWRVGIDPARVRGPQGGWVARRKPGTGARGGGGRRRRPEERRRMESVERRKSAASSNPASTPRAGAAASASSVCVRVRESVKAEAGCVCALPLARRAKRQGRGWTGRVIIIGTRAGALARSMIAKPGCEQIIVGNRPTRTPRSFAEAGSGSSPPPSSTTPSGKGRVFDDAPSTRPIISPASPARVTRSSTDM